MTTTIMMIDPLYLTAFGLMAIGTMPPMVLAPSAPVVGSAAPDFTLTCQEGTPVSLREYRGKRVVLYFYPKDFTPGCTLEARNFQRDQLEYQRKNALALGISLDTAASHRKCCAEESLSFKLLADSEQTLSKAYGSLTNLLLVKFAARRTFIIDPDGKVARVFTSVSPRNHSEEVLASLAELQRHNRPNSRESDGELEKL